MFRHVLLVVVLAAALSCRTTRTGPAVPPASIDDKKTIVALLDAAGLDRKQQQLVDDKARVLLLRLAEQTRCPCETPTPRTLAECSLDKSCGRGPFALRSILRGALRGESEAKIGTRLLSRFGPREAESIDLAGAACRGAAAAPATLVIFSDFECPGCAMGRKMIEVLERAFGERLRVCFKNYPLDMHPNAQLAARAGIAAQRQGRFWPMHDQLFDNQNALERTNLEDYARAARLDLKRFRQDLDSDSAKQQVLADIAEGNRLKLRYTPTFFVNNREVTDATALPDLADWIAEAIVLSAPAPRPASVPARR